MAADYIAVTKTNRPQLGAQLVNLANQLREVRDLCDALNDVAGHMHDAGVYTVFETQFGVTGGANVVSLMGLVQTILNGSGEVTGANRLAQLNEFVDRLAGQ
jgi:hypothetical protein